MGGLAPSDKIAPENGTAAVGFFDLCGNPEFPVFVDPYLDHWPLKKVL